MDLIEFTRYALWVDGGVRLGLVARSSRVARGGSTVANASGRHADGIIDF